MDQIYPYNDYSDHIVKTRETTIQIVLSLALGVFAFLTFCLLRPRWSGLYAARKRQTDRSSALPELPSTFFGWIVPLWRITDQQVLASAGLDAYVFLAFFKMAIKFLSITLFFSLAVIKPVHDSYPDDDKPGHKKNGTQDDALFVQQYATNISLHSLHDFAPWVPEYVETDYLWMYPVFAYLFSIMALYMLVAETRRIIEVRQEYLGSQTTITDRTIRLSGIPESLQAEDKIKDFIEELGIGKVESVTLCRDWKELDEAVVHRNVLLRKLEEAWTVYLGHRTVERNLESLPITQPSPPGPTVDGDTDHDETRTALLSHDTQAAAVPYARTRPMAKLRYGRFGWNSKSVDAIDYYEEKLRGVDEKITDLRQKDFKPTPLAFVTMDSVAACQMASQAVLNPSPLQLLANPSPAPADVIWPNTYITRRKRMFRAWSITVFIGLLTIFWSFILVPIATALNTDTIKKVFPGLAKSLKEHPTANSLVTTQLPTLIISLLNVAVPYLYAWLATLQGMTSQGDVELSVISKNFFFTFFNFFIVFTVLGTASNFLQDLQKIGDSLKDATLIAYTLAESLQRLLTFYVNFIILQGIGLFPFRLLEFGSVATYPIGLMGAKTPRDYAELVQPPTFSYGFYLPQTILIFVICVVYSVLRESWMVILSGLIYFLIGSYVYKYQLLYAMDHRQHSTGRAWVMICDRFIVGIILFQITVGGQLALKKALIRSALLIPLLVGTIWFTVVYARTYRPLMKFIALRSIRRAEQSDYNRADDTDDDGNERYDSETHHGTTVDESRESGMRFVNPSLIAPLEPVWIADKNGVTENGNGRHATNGMRGDELA
ncbi:hypothetical protein AAFC00_003625 [Neodothiora populina]|uniref:DUF221-domain-containing protein n=1 Tax=Neodothiora populina TaxID=2781224 RepID=A0ABR3PEU7_9PEZI